MTSYSAAASPSRPQTISKESFGMVLFLIAETMFFAALAGAYIVLRIAKKGEWRPAGLDDIVSAIVIANTVVLALSSVSMWLTQIAAKRKDPWMKLFLQGTLALGLLFLAGQALEFRRMLEIVSFGGNLFGSVFYSIAGLHGLHVAGGILLLVIVLFRAYRKPREEVVVWVRMTAAYWHYVVLVWAFLFWGLYVW